MNGLTMYFDSLLIKSILENRNSEMQPDNEKKSQVVQCIIINSSNEVLLIKRAPKDTHGGNWEIPTGGVDRLDRDLYVAIAREVIEETGIDVKSPMFVRTELKSDTENGTLFDVSLYLVDQNDDPDSDFTVTLSEEHTRFKWIGFDKKSINDFQKTNVLDSWTKEQLSFLL